MKRALLLLTVLGMAGCSSPRTPRTECTLPNLLLFLTTARAWCPLGNRDYNYTLGLLF
jgi:hypothetical protein